MEPLDSASGSPREHFLFFNFRVGFGVYEERRFGVYALMRSEGQGQRYPGSHGDLFQLIKPMKKLTLLGSLTEF